MENQQNALPKDWRKWLRQLRGHPDWSSLNGRNADLEDNRRQLFIDKICAEMVNNSEQL